MKTYEMVDSYTRNPFISKVGNLGSMFFFFFFCSLMHADQLKKERKSRETKLGSTILDSIGESGYPCLLVPDESIQIVGIS